MLLAPINIEDITDPLPMMMMLFLFGPNFFGTGCDMIAIGLPLSRKRVT